ncbi:uncharacterized protein LOC129602263 [Paramacrobiotus metropolitanus]|uniref:uncharacterized protein LOC129602263 n=1 Tax=Paramacrobiotus metropolitanus TaxID=2943436 RepID=UPI00244584F8|nr:uncharacterized protein LOC129602263 [Paramacrobiotus metropolitanus]
MGDAAGDTALPGFLQTTFGYVEDVWVKGPALLSDYASLARDTWKAYTDSQSKRFEHLPAEQQQKLMNSGLDGAVIFLLITLVSREILDRFVEPFIVTHTQPPGKGAKPALLTFQQAKWIFTSIILLSIWHSNSHMFFDFGAPVDLGLLVVAVAAGLGTMYQTTHSPAASAIFLLIPLLALAPVSVTVAAMQQGPFFTDPTHFPCYLAGITVATALYFLYDAPATSVIHPGDTHPTPFWTALRSELAALRTTQAVPAAGLKKGAPPPKSPHHGDHHAPSGAGGIRNALVGPVYKVAGLVHVVYQAVMNAVWMILGKIPVLGGYVHAGTPVKGRVGARPITASRSGAPATPPKLSNRVSRRREEE